MRYAVYILECHNGAYYVGMTNNLERRLSEHHEGLDPKSYTFNRRPVKLVFQEYFQNVNHAIDFEKQIKGWRREKKEALIARNWDLLPELAKNYSLKSKED
ncbi:GIY-YIG nuclease family protein [Marinoscillum furvescens]|nr:GIY-YIG nuclease family protein [Marinoscillum furvescens]